MDFFDLLLQMIRTKFLGMIGFEDQIFGFQIDRLRFSSWLSEFEILLFMLKVVMIRYTCCREYGTIPTATTMAKVGVFRGGMFYLRDAAAFGCGLAGDKLLTGDWNGDGTTTAGIFRNGMFALGSSNTNRGGTVNSLNFGMPGDIPVAGTWA